MLDQKQMMELACVPTRPQTQNTGAQFRPETKTRTSRQLPSPKLPAARFAFWTVDTTPSPVQKVDRGPAEMSEVSSSSYPGSMAGQSAIVEEEEERAALGLGLGLGKKHSSGIGEKRDGVPLGRYGWVPAEDVPPSMGSRTSPVSLSSSSSSSTTGCERGVGSAKVVDKPPSQTVVGWPPVGLHRLNSLHNQSKYNKSLPAGVTSTHEEASQNIKNNETKDRICWKRIAEEDKFSGSSFFVKVNLDGDPIGRKVNLNSHLSYVTLALALEAMFFKSTLPLRSSTDDPITTSVLLEGKSGFALTYEDKDGDWMLIGDVPWRMFLNTVKRLRIMKTSDASGLAPKFRSCSKSGCS